MELGQKTVKFCFLPLTLTYNISELTQRARLLGSVHGVVVQAIRATSWFSTNGKLTMTDGSWTSWRQKWNKRQSQFNIYILRVYFVNTTALDHSRCERVLIRANLVVLVGLKVRQGGVAGRGERHDFDPSVNKTLVIQLFENPPEWIEDE